MFRLRSASFLTCEPLEKAGFVNAFGTRHCPTSAPDNFTAALGNPIWDLHLTKQIHSDIRILVPSPFRERARVREQGEGDALLTEAAEVFLGIKTADCVPVLIGDPKTGAMAAVHAGWRGTAGKIAEKSVRDLITTFHANPEDLIAAIGPNACADCYEVGPEVAEQFGNEFLRPTKSAGKYMLDVAGANRRQLVESGLKESNIHLAPHCTMHENDLFFSHRREGGDGRQLSVIGRHS